MTVEGIEKNTRTKSTFNTHQNENTRVIVWLFYNHKHVIHDELCSTLQDIIETVDYDTMLSRKYRGKKSVEERKNVYLFQQLRDKVAEVLGTPGSTTNKKTVTLFDQFVADPKIYVDYLAKRRKGNGGLMKPSVYKSYRASLSFLFWRYEFQVPEPEQFNIRLKTYMDGIKRLANKARQCDEGNIIEDGKRPLNFEIFLQFNKWFLEMGTYEGIIYALAYSLATFNLACRGDSTLMICLKHLMWKGDATGVPFSHSKEEQLGDDPTRDCHVTASAIRSSKQRTSSPYMTQAATNLELFDNKDGPLFPGARDSHSTKFSNTLKIILKDPEKREVIQKQYAFDPDDIGVHLRNSRSL